jgi:hypothetical protein
MHLSHATPQNWEAAIRANFSADACIESDTASCTPPFGDPPPCLVEARVGGAGGRDEYLHLGVGGRPRRAPMLTTSSSSRRRPLSYFATT